MVITPDKPARRTRRAFQVGCQRGYGDRFAVGRGVGLGRTGSIVSLVTNFTPPSTAFATVVRSGVVVDTFVLLRMVPGVATPWP